MGVLLVCIGTQFVINGARDLALDTKTGKASLSIKLTGRDTQKLTGTLADLPGTHTVAPTACDGTAVSVAYAVNADGTVAYTSATGGTPTVRTFSHGAPGFAADFGTLRLRVSARLVKQPDGTYLLLAGYQKRCGGKNTPAPTTNAPVAPGASNPPSGNPGAPGRGGHGGFGPGSGGPGGFGRGGHGHGHP